MSVSLRVSIAMFLAIGLCGNAHTAPISVTCESYTPGAVTGGLNTAAYKDTSAAKFQDFPRDTGGGTNKFARGLSNNSFAASTILPIGANGGATFKFQQPIKALADAKEFVIYNGTFLSQSGGFFYGDMEAAILVSNDNSEWRTLNGAVVADPLTYTASISEMNAPSMSYVWGTGKIAWDYPTQGKSQSVLDTFALTDYGTPMPNDSLFNGAATNADRAALRTNTDPAVYTDIFGSTGGGNWFDISNTGLAQIQYLRLNVAAAAPAIVRLDSIFANNVAAVPEPAALLLLVVGAVGLLAGRSRRSLAVVLLVIAVCPLTAEASPYASFDFSDIDYWIGEGSNQAALVVDFRTPSGDASFAWGYQWDGAATGEDMFRAIAGTTVLRERDGGEFLGTFAGADSRLFLRASGFSGGLGNSVFGIGYDVDGDGGSFVSGYEGNEIGHATDSDDLYREGWFNGFWGYYISSPAAPAWSFSGLGFSSRQLTNGSWDGWSFADFVAGDFGGPPGVPVAAPVPEPATWALLLVGLIALVRRRFA